MEKNFNSPGHPQEPTDDAFCPLSEELAEAPFPEDGVFVVDKISGMTSFSVTKQVKRVFSLKKAGHLGTLDPLATGILPVLFGKATKLMDHLMASEKVYDFVIDFGQETSTDDAEGHVVKTSSTLPEKEAIQRVLPDFIGEISQVPSIYSAIKVGGVPAYRRARKGQVFPMAPRQVTIKALELLSYRKGQGGLRVRCGPGTYVRSLGRDIARALGSCGHLSALRRVQVGFFNEGFSGRHLSFLSRKKFLEEGGQAQRHGKNRRIENGEYTGAEKQDAQGQKNQSKKAQLFLPKNSSIEDLQETSNKSPKNFFHQTAKNTEGPEQISFDSLEKIGPNRLGRYYFSLDHLNDILGIR
jgi:tRNA pseudouridine(55) synthase